jgi:hypothetical protein
MRNTVQLASVALLLAASTSALAIADAPPKLPPDRAPSLMTSTEIRAYNEGLDSTHPYFIKCRKDPVVGSLVRKLRVCRTNEDWKRFAAVGNDSGREVLDDMTRAPVSGNTPAFDACPAGRC